MSDQWARIGLDLHLRIDRARGLRGGLEHALREAVRSGRLSPGNRLPSSRVLALELGVARGTVTQVYEQLTAEGFLTSRPRSGVRVAPRPGAAPGPVLPPAPSFRPPVDGFDLRPGLPDLATFPRREWLAATRQVLQSAPHSVFGYGDPTGHADLRQALAEYLGRSRGVITTPEHIIVCAGYTHALRIVCRALSRAGASIAFEDPALPDYPAMAAEIGLRVEHIAVDQAGLVVGALGDAAAAVVTPAHQFPLGVTLAPQRRLQLLDWARRNGSLVVEDDYDGEFRYDRQPVGALQALAPGDVVYAGTVSKSVAPALRIAWLAAPTRVVPALREALRHDEAHVNVIDQLVLAHLIRRGDLDRHLRRCRARYRHRRDHLGRVVAARLPGARLSGIAAGLHAVLHLPGPARDEARLLDRLRENGVAVDGLSTFYHRPEEAPLGVVIGYATPQQHEYESAVDALVEAAGA
ncbi:PLP-dependent aminotransferase family protein [Paractinoplanes atraurantiacus]|uniref:GntR family transcriptional regulator / MocR family aminotransferase n=1 Tax=Paractinoplanes atraurantiacus TaxID=1036182 RepID=A0A285JLN8_9ACTN|nr:PLP-dependent aminotransferase family protein [Actinoplanes atraurantiacus]SNY60983.1 GntR family transcriptional regulator / MocR family aminotransferase [Actinoplanes atraurantiacus]